MRILLDEAALGWDEAWDLTVRTLAYTNHTLLPEALENWPVEPLRDHACRGSSKSSTRSTAASWTTSERAIPATTAALARVSLIEEGPEKRVRMANLAIVGTHSTNGVAEIHSRLLRTTVVSDFAEMFPERFNNKTNGVTPRRWLLLANPDLARLITERDRRRLGHRPRASSRSSSPLADDAGFRDGFRQAKRAAKVRFADWLRMATGLAVDPDTIFDSQIKRIHEYKRQLLNVLHIIVLYNRLRDNPKLDVPPRTFFFAGKAAPAYTLAKLIIKLINNVAAVVNADPAIARQAQGLLPARIQREPGPAADPRQRRVGADLHRRLRGQRHQQHEVHDERRSDRRHPRRRHDRDGRGGRRGEFLPVRPDRRAGRRQPRLVQPALALRARAGDAARPST